MLLHLKYTNYSLKDLFHASFKDTERSVDQTTRIYLTLKKKKIYLHVDNECKCQILSLVNPRLVGLQSLTKFVETVPNSRFYSLDKVTTCILNPILPFQCCFYIDKNENRC